MSVDQKLREIESRVREGGASKYHEKNAEQGKLFARKRIELLFDPGSFVEDALLANAVDPELPADGVITGSGLIHGRRVCVMANDSTVKAGSWGKRTVEKILRIQETARRLSCPLYYLVDSAGAGHWYPCQAAGTRAFGGMPDQLPILQKGDSFRDPDRPGKSLRYVSDFCRGSAVSEAGSPKVDWIRGPA